MNKEQTIQAIKELPLFELKKVAIQEQDWILQPNDKAVTELNKTTSITYVTNRYKLIQFYEVLTPMVENIEEFQCQLQYHWGVCIAHLFPTNPEFTKDNIKYGISIINSVNKSTSVIIKFSVLHNGNVLIFPKKLAGYKKNHTGKGLQLTQDYIQVVSKVQEMWGNIIKHYPEHIITKDTLKDTSEQFELSQKKIDQIEYEILTGQEINLWDIIEYKLDEINDKNYTSDIHKTKALEKLCAKIYDYALVLAI